MRAWSWFASLVLVGVVLSPNPDRERSFPRFASEIPPVSSADPIFRFNGTDLTGFYTFTRYSKFADPRHVFSVRDGMIRISGEEPGGLATRESFANYHLVVEWRWGTLTWPPRRFEARNSGIMVHSVGPDGDALACWMESIECQINEGGCGDLIVVPGKTGEAPQLTSEVRVDPDGQIYYEKGGSPKTLRRGRFNWWGREPGWKNILWYRGERDVEKPAGEWNRMEVVCEDDSIMCILNGVLVNAGTRSSLKAGKILLQSEGAEIYFRKFEIRSLIR